MKLMNLFLCWMYGHVKDELVTGFVMADYEFDVSICKRCGATIVYDSDMNVWDKW